MKGSGFFLAVALLALNGFSSCPACCYWEIICTWILLLFFHMGKESCLSSCGPYRWHLFHLRVRGSQVKGVGWGSPRQPFPRGGEKGSQCQTNVYRKFSLQWISLLQQNNRRVWYYIIHASSLFWFYLWILANNRWLGPLLFWEIGR